MSNNKTIKWSYLGKIWNIVKTKIDLPLYVLNCYKKGIRQNINYYDYERLSLSIASIYASNLYNGFENDNINSISSWTHASEFKEFFFDSLEETLELIYSSIKDGRPVIIQIEDSEINSTNHFVTVFGYLENLSKKELKKEENLIYIDSYDSRIKIIDLKKRKIINGKEANKYYNGYIVKILK